jgi:histidinol-phosphate aminotransferase
VKVDDANAVYDFLVENKVVVRNRTTQPNCEDCLRITVGTDEENQALVEALKKYI